MSGILSGQTPEENPKGQNEPDLDAAQKLEAGFFEARDESLTEEELEDEVKPKLFENTVDDPENGFVEEELEDGSAAG